MAEAPGHRRRGTGPPRRSGSDLGRSRSTAVSRSSPTSSTAAT